MTTVYTVCDGRGDVWSVTDADRAERLSRWGYTVTAQTQ